MIDLFNFSTLLSIAYLSIRWATPYLYAAIGELFAERAGVLNLGVEGIMVMGSYIGFFVFTKTGDLWLGFILAAGIGLLMALFIALATVTFQAVQAITGIGINMIGLGLSSLLFIKMMKVGESIPSIPPVKIPFLGDLPVIGQVFFNHSPIVYGAFMLVPVAHWLLNHTTLGLSIRAVGENPDAADSLGVNVTRVRYFSVCLGGLLAGIAGASLSVTLLNLFQENLTNGMGFIAISLVVFGGWSPWPVLVGALLFSSVNALQLWIQIKNVPIPSDFAAMMPYILTLIVLMFGARHRGRQPAALTKPFER